MKKTSALILTSIIIILFLFSIGYVKLHEIAPESSFPAVVLVPPGTTYNGLINRLKNDGLIKNIITFKIYNKLFSLSNSLKPGKYVFKSPASGKKILDSIVKGQSELIKITIPEGYRLREIFASLSRNFPVADSVFFNLARNDHFVLKTTRNTSDNLEGFLYPETYYFNYYAEPKLILKKMTDVFFEKIGPLWDKHLDNHPFDFYQTLTLASIIQKETYLNEEYGKVSSVYHNRLKNRMKLQACPTVQYLLKENKKLLYEDLKIESPYNTYIRRGLPPGPICSPSDTAFHYALFPESTDYLYFLAELNGKHYFSKTIKEHNKKKREIKRQKRRLKYEHTH